MGGMGDDRACRGAAMERRDGTEALGLARRIVPTELQQMIDDFDGTAATVRFDDGAVEVEYAMSNYQHDMTKFIDSQNGADMVAGLPDDTVAAFGLALEEGWAGAMLDYVKTRPARRERDDRRAARRSSRPRPASPSRRTSRPCLGEGVTVSLGSGIDPDAIANGGPGRGPGRHPDQGRRRRDPGRARQDRRAGRARAGRVHAGDRGRRLRRPRRCRTTTAASSRAAATSATATPTRRSSESDEAQSVLFVNFDADDDWLVRLTGDSPEVSENLEPLSAFGVSGWVDGDVVHGLLKVTTD